jgi:hypothetical protein
MGIFQMLLFSLPHRTASAAGVVTHAGRRIAMWALLLALGLLSGDKASAQCQFTFPITAARWVFTTLHWTYSGSLPKAAVTQGAAGWNSGQSFTAISEGTFFDDITIVDSNSIGTNQAEIQLYRMDNAHPTDGPNPCAGKQSYSCPSLCFNSAKLWRADMRLSPNNIAGAAYGWAGYWGLSTLDAIARATQIAVAHEIGHFFSLGDVSAPQNCSNPTIMSLNDTFYCKLTQQTACDNSTVASRYSGVTMYPSSCFQCAQNGTACF